MSEGEDLMTKQPYEKPTLERLGLLRSLTRLSF